MGAVAAVLVCVVGFQAASAQPATVTVKKADAAQADEPLPTLPRPPGASLPVPTVPDAPAAGPTESIPKRHHPWARFEPGAWRTIRTITESFDPTGKYVGRSETTQTETLVAVTENQYTIQSSTVVHVGGKQLRGATTQATYHLLTDTPGELVQASPLPPANLNLDGRVVSCRRWQLTLGSGPQRRLETVYYSPDLSPHILRREASAADGTGESTEVQSTMSVVRVDAPVTYDEEIVPGSHATILSQSGTHRIERTQILTDVAPGGMVSATSTERDGAGRRIRWSTTDLVDCGQAGDEPRPRRRWRLFRRRGE